MHSSRHGLKPLPVGLYLSSRPASASTGATEAVDIVAMARESRRSAEAFGAAVRRYSAEMPDALDRFHEAMTSFRDTAHRLRNGLPLRRDRTG